MQPARTFGLLCCIPLTLTACVYRSDLFCTSTSLSCAYTVGGIASGVATGTVELLLDDRETLVLRGDGPFVFALQLRWGDSYEVRLRTAPTGLTCDVASGSGTVGRRDVDEVQVICHAAAGGGNSAHSIGVTVRGLGGGMLTLTLNGSESLAVTADGVFTFASQLAENATYDVHVANVSVGLTCSVSNGAGIVGAEDVAGIDVQCQKPAVVPLYPLAADWLDFIKNDGANIYAASSTACDRDFSPAPRGYRECLNGGQLRVLTLPNESSCVGLTAGDSGGVFEWRCDASTGAVRWISFLLLDGKGLADLLEADGAPRFKQLSLTVRRGTETIAWTSPALWWGNPVVDAASNGVSLATARPSTSYARIGPRPISSRLPARRLPSSPSPAPPSAKAGRRPRTW
jgi:hypothetical protein